MRYIFEKTNRFPRCLKRFLENDHNQDEAKQKTNIKPITRPSQGKLPSAGMIEGISQKKVLFKKARKNQKWQKNSKNNPFPFIKKRPEVCLPEAQGEQEPGAGQCCGCDEPPLLPAHSLFRNQGVVTQPVKHGFYGQDDHPQGKGPVHKRPEIPGQRKNCHTRTTTSCNKMKNRVEGHNIEKWANPPQCIGGQEFEVYPVKFMSMKSEANFTGVS